MTNISDVAKMAGVSRTAVSFAFNDSSHISKETLARIHAAAEELGYYPDPAARRLITKRADVLGLLVPQKIAELFANPFFASLLRGIGHVCDRYNYAVLLVPPVQGSLTGALRRAAVDGFIVVGLDEAHPAILALHRRRIPFVTVDGPTLPHIPAVNVDDRAGTYQAAKHLLDLGHRDVLIVSTRPAEVTQATEAVPPFSFVAGRRLAGYRAAFDEAGVPFRDEYVIPADTTHEGGQRALRTVWLAGARPGAVLAMSDITALGVMEAARGIDLSIPADLSVIGFDDIPPASWSYPALTTHPDPRSEQYAITCQGRRHPYQLTATYLSDPLRPTVLIHIRLAAPAHAAPLSLYVRYDAALNGNGTNDSGQVAGSALLAHDDQGHYGPVASALIANPALAGATTGYAGAGDDAAVSFRTRFTAGPRYMQAGPGNIVQGAYVPLRANGEADLALGFGGAETAALSTARASLSQPFARTAAAFIAGWHGYAARLTQPDPRFSLVQRDQYSAAALALKASEDKRYPGALVASLSTPWGPSVPANQNSGQGYHRVWARDLYEMATGFIADGDRATARDIIHYMLNTLEGPDGSVPQNSLVDGTPVDSGIQMDEIALPLILAWSLGVDDQASYTTRLRSFADYLVRHGPITNQERWEEDGGYSPSTIAAEIAGLACAAAIAGKNGDASRALVYQAVADEWQRSVKSWTVTATGRLARHPYFIRLDDNLDPNDGAPLSIAGGGAVDERMVVDAGFLELIRLGLLSPTDRDVLASLAVIDATIRVNTVDGPAWYRYNHDTYGDAANGAPWNQPASQGLGHPWPVFDGERAEYELSLGHAATARSYLEVMRRFASPTGLIPEQVWERAPVAASPAGTDPLTASIAMAPGQADGSATPLNWALGQYIRLAADLQSGAMLDEPSITRARYVTHAVGHALLRVTSPAADLTGHGPRQLTIAGKAAPGSRLVVLAAGNIGALAYDLTVAADGSFSRAIALPQAYAVRVSIGAQDGSGRTALVVRKVLG